MPDRNTGNPPRTERRRKKVWLVLDRNDVAVLIGALESVFEGYSPREFASGLVDDENRLWELLREKLAAHDLGRALR